MAKDWYKPQAGYRNPTDEADPDWLRKRDDWRQRFVEAKQKKKLNAKDVLIWLAVIVWLVLLVYLAANGYFKKPILPPDGEWYVPFWG
jgi:hypothetical protein